MNVVQLITNINNNMPNDITEGSLISWINTLEDTMYSKFIKEPTPDPKTVEHMGGEELALSQYGARWNLIYEYFIYAQICMLQEEFGKANNYFMLYNSLIDEFVQFYFGEVLDNTVRTDRIKNFR